MDPSEIITSKVIDVDNPGNVVKQQTSIYVDNCSNAHNSTDMYEENDTLNSNDDFVTINDGEFSTIF